MRGADGQAHDLTYDFLGAILAASAQPGVPDELANVQTALANGDGFWTSYTGCHELNEGHSTGRWSEALQCHLGLGCSECGGIGAIWDDTDYEAMAGDMAADIGQNVSAPTPPADGGNHGA